MDTTWLVTSYTDTTSLAHQPIGKPGSGISAIVNDRVIPFNIPHNVAFLLPHPSIPEIWYATVETITTDGLILVLRYTNHSVEICQQVSAGGKSTCYLHYDLATQTLLAVNYWDSNYTTYPVNTKGFLGTLLQTTPPDSFLITHQPDKIYHWKYRQRWSHRHCCILEPYTNTTYFMPDLGNDCIHVLRHQPNSTTLSQIGQVNLTKGRGPRHLLFHPTYRVGYLVNELDSTISVLEYRDKAKSWLTEIQNISSLPDTFNNECTTNSLGIWKAKSHSSEIRLHPNGSFLYVSNRGHNSICVLTVLSTGRLQFVETISSGGRTPRNFNLNQSGTEMLVANQDSDCCCRFSVSSLTGTLQLEETIPVASPNYVIPIATP